MILDLSLLSDSPPDTLKYFLPSSSVVSIYPPPRWLFHELSMANWNSSPAHKSNVIEYTFPSSLFVKQCSSLIAFPQLDEASKGLVPLPTIAKDLVSSTFSINPAKIPVSSVIGWVKSKACAIDGVANHPINT